MEYFITVNASGTDGSAAGTGDTEAPVRGWLEAVEYTYINAPATTTIAATENDSGRALATVGAGNTNGVVYPRAAAVNTAGVAITNSFARIFLAGHSVHVAVAAANHNSVVVIRLVVSGEWE